MENYSIFIDEPAHFSEKSMNILLKWMSENEQRCKEHSKVIDKVMNPITNKPNWIS